MTTTVESPYRTSSLFPEADVDERELTIPYEGQNRMRLLFAAGISDLVLHVDPDQTALLRARFGGVVPQVLVTPGEVRMRHRFGFGDWLGGVFCGDPTWAIVALHPGLAWELVFRGGASEVDADLQRGRVTSIEISGGASAVDIALPAPGGVVPVRVSGGASELAIRRPASVPVGVHVSGGASSLEVDERHFGAVGESVSLASDGWAAADARYDVRVAGGASDVIVTS